MSLGSEQKFNFVKMHGAGNDFIVFDARNYPDLDFSELAKKVCHRRFSVGADGIVGLLDSDKADFQMFYYNADGSRAVCGNGLRCLVRFIYDRENKERSSKPLLVDTDDGIASIWTTDSEDSFKVDMGLPRFDASEIPTTGEGSQLNIELEADGKKFVASAASMGNPHCVIVADDLDDNLVHGAGAAIETHPYFPERTNVEFIKLIGPNQVRMRVWERGVGETLACGTGNAAVFAVCMENSLISGPKLQLSSPGGEFSLEYGEEGRVLLTGPTAEVFEGTIDLDDRN